MKCRLCNRVMEMAEGVKENGQKVYIYFCACGNSYSTNKPTKKGN